MSTSSALTISISQNDQIKLARALVNPNKEVRDKTCETLHSFFASSPKISDIEMLKLWKALYYCMWLTDKAPIQTEIANFLCNIIDSIPKKANTQLYIRMFYRTILREWPLLDQHRLDKFYKLLRLMIRKVFSYLHERNYPLKLTQQLLEVLNTEVLTKTPNGVRFHIIDVYLEELMEVSNGDIETKQFLLLIEPFLSLLSTSRDQALFDRIIKQIFHEFLNKYTESSLNGEIENNEIKKLFTNVKRTAIQYALFQIASDEQTNPNNRPKIYAIHKEYAIQTGLPFVTEDIINDIESDHIHEDKTKKNVKKMKTSEKIDHDDEDDEDIENSNHKKRLKVSNKRNIGDNEDHTNGHDNHSLKKNNDSRSTNNSISSSINNNQSENDKKKIKVNPNDKPANSSTSAVIATNTPSHKKPTPAVVPSTPVAPVTTASAPVTTASAPVTTASAPVTTASAEPVEFIASVKFQHYKPGYIFQKVS